MFDSSTMSAGFYNGNATDTPTKAKGGNQNRMQSIVPVCLRQLLTCSSEEFSLFGFKAQIVSVVGILRDYNVSTIKATYTVEDHTGSIKAVLWLDSDASETMNNLPPVKEGRYLKVFGSIRVNDNEKTLLVLKMVPVDDPNVITTHLLEIIHTRYAAEKMSKDLDGVRSFTNPNASLANTMSHIYDDNSHGCNFTPIQQKVLNLFKGDNTQNGKHLNSLLSNFPNNQYPEVHKAIEFLQMEGHVYTTIDTNHFKATD